MKSNTFISTVSFLMLIFIVLSGETTNAQASIGSTAPDFKLKNTDYKKVALSDYATQKGVILVFTCNHCPYSKLYEQRINELHREYEPQKYPVIAINSNDSTAYQDDSFSSMVKKGYTFDYLLDDQGVYAQYGATKTPHFYVLKNEGPHFSIAYIGALDDNPRDPAGVKTNYIKDAIAALEGGKKPDPAFTKAIGCGISPFK